MSGADRAGSDEPAARRVAAWLEALERRHLSTLTFAEVRRALVALSSLYVERRAGLPRGEALGSAGKRAAFALFYGPLHFRLIGAIVRGLAAGGPAPRTVVDLGCGTGVASAAWALERGGLPVLEGVDRSGWAVDEARWTWGRLRLRGHAQRRELASTPLEGRRLGVVCAFTANELEERARGALLGRLLKASATGAQVLVVEPLSTRVSPWWTVWRESFVRQGGREDVWRVPWVRSQTLALLDHAAGLDHREIAGRSLWLGAPAGGYRQEVTGSRAALSTDDETSLI